MHLFDGVRYHLVHSLPEQRALALAHVLNNNGAIQADSIDDKALTHLITNSNRFERWQDVSSREEAGSLFVVTDKWVDKSMVLGKLQPPSCYSSDPAMIFSGVVACASELPTSDLEVLSAGITALGGQWRTGLTRDVTHLFVIKPSSPKYETALHFKEHTNVKVLLPHWFDDAVRIGTGALDTTPYEWPNPPLLRDPPADDATSKEHEIEMKKAALRKLDPEKKVMYRTADLLSPDAPLPLPNQDNSNLTLDTVSSAQQPSARASPGKLKNVWQGRRVLLGRSLELSGSRKDAVEAEIRRSGGEIVGYEGGREEEAAAVGACDVFVARYRSGKAYVQAVRLAKTIGTLPWVFHVQSMGVLSSPMNQLLWYPIPKRPIEGFSAHEITVTNYTGESREYIKKLIAAMGATFTPSMSGKNTVLIAAYISGTKTTKAASWSIPVVNHVWLEDCFVKWRNLTVALEKYIVFPPGVDFSLMLGERGVGRTVEDVGEDDLEALEQEDDAADDNDDDDVEGEKKKAELGQQGKDGGEGELVRKNGVSQGTQNSARDAREVEEVVEAGLDKDGDVPMEESLVNTKQPQKQRGKAKELFSAAKSNNDDMSVDEADVEPDPAPHKPFSSGTQQRSTKSMGDRLQHKGDSAARTRVKPRTAKGKAKPAEEQSPTPEVVVTRRRGGKIRVTPLKKRNNIRVEDLQTSESSSSSNSGGDGTEEEEGPGPAEKRGKNKLVRRLGERSSSWIADAVVVTPLKSGAKTKVTRDQGRKKELSGSSDEEDDRQEKVVRRGKPQSKAIFTDDEGSGEGDDGNVGRGKGVNKRGKRSGGKLVVSEESGDDEAVVKRGKHRKGGGTVASDDEEIEEMVVGRKGRKTSAATSKNQTRPKSKSSDEESGERPEKTIVTYQISSRASKGKAKAAEVEETVERTAKPRRAGVSKRVVSTPESEESSHSDLSPKSKATKSTQKASLGRNKHPARGRERSASPVAVKKNASVGAGTSTQRSAKKNKLSSFVSSDEDEDEDEPPLPKQKLSQTTVKPKGRQNGAATSTHSPVVSETPGRTVSVILPHTTTPKSAKLPTAPPSRSPNKIRFKSPLARPRASSTSSAPPAEDDEDVPIPASGRTKRSAAAKATQKLHEEVMPDVMNYQQEMRNAGRGRRSSGAAGASPVVAEHSKGKKRLSDGGEGEKGHGKDAKRRKLAEAGSSRTDNLFSESEDAAESVKHVKRRGRRETETETDSEDEDASVSNGRHTKKIIKGNASPTKSSQIRLMTTQVTLPDDVLRMLNKLGVKITTRPAECTHLLAPHLVRTEKLLCALANAAFILNEKWATDSASTKRLLDEGDYLLRDKVNERKFDFVLSDALARAQELQGTLFAKMVFYVTPKVPIDFKLLKNVVTACGGLLNTQPPTLRILNASPDRYIISCPEDAPIWRPISRAHAVYTHELILTSALKQEIDWENEKFKVPGSC